MDAETFFIEHAVGYARTLPLPDAVAFLRGMSLSVKDGSAADSVRKIVVVLSDSDKQLELIQTGQLKLALN
jgi:hypothetical protein